MLKKWRLISLFTILTLVLAGCGEPFLSTLKPAGEVADQQYFLMILSTLIMVVVVIVVSFIFIFVIVKYRRSRLGEDHMPKQIEGNRNLEILWTVIPIILLLVLVVPVVAQTFSQADTKPMDKKNRDPEKTLVVNVRANLYWWEFEYPDYGVVTSQELVVPTDERVYFKLKASDVKHSFWVPSAGGKIDTNTDNDNKFFLTFDSKKAEQAGEYFYGKCAELCGPSHALMDFKVKALPKDEFKQWMKNMENDKSKPKTDLAVEGEKVFKEKNCLSCHATDAKDQRAEAARTAPNLATFGERSKIAGVKDFNDENLRAWLKDPESIKPGNKMTGTYPALNDKELDALTEYLKGLKTQD
ncbi:MULTISPECIES: cytochrome c oxidase subunit II [Bacillus]|uniref:Cytochrome c oxidase subunit 2 n=1 Tax=Bacillus glycinifermentans TaxID=1664069 RepID=A0AAJ3YXK1_9BACI|nr:MULTISPECIES: cytochrome c oxidase subunit II [Bacillus]KKB73874.1 cytochrome B [Bacillus sp. TH008]MBU8786281.1 cytochrome c oxidase subunit II [Bacillus glycinifermentans]MDU0071998.1 cytochrome c oxidase subunit II [Bacillus sp. IG6]MED8019550.1 cytochrome c oxidase subunit II [Bacillus glycinifermentans]NUJ18218.1 cytochrome c oxidase subunit II [Bacillus glycinifermentans]